MKQESGKDFDLQVWKPAYFKVDDRNEMLTMLYREALEHVLLPRIKSQVENEMLSHLDSHDLTWGSTKT